MRSISLGKSRNKILLLDKMESVVSTEEKIEGKLHIKSVLVQKVFSFGTTSVASLIKVPRSYTTLLSRTVGK